MQNQLLIISGPSCVGKTPLLKSFNRIYTDLRKFEPLVLYTSREPRKNEIDGKDYYFSNHKEMEQLELEKRLITFNVRRDLFGLKTHDLNELGAASFVYEGNAIVSSFLIQNVKAKAARLKSIFVSPLSRKEIEYIRSDHKKDLEKEIKKLMLEKQYARARQIFEHIDDDRELDLTIRADSAYSELALAWQFDAVLPNHDGEGHPNWQPEANPRGDARLSVENLRKFVLNVPSVKLEAWDKQLIP